MENPFQKIDTLLRKHWLNDLAKARVTLPSSIEKKSIGSRCEHCIIQHPLASALSLLLCLILLSITLNWLWIEIFKLPAIVNLSQSQIIGNVNRLIGPLAAIAGLALTASALIINNVSAKKEHFIDIVTNITWLYFTFFFALLAVGYGILANVFTDDYHESIWLVISTNVLAIFTLALIGRLVKQLSIVTKKQSVHQNLFQKFLDIQITIWDSKVLDSSKSQILEDLQGKIIDGNKLQFSFDTNYATDCTIPDYDHPVKIDLNVFKIGNVISRLNSRQDNLKYNLTFSHTSGTNWLRLIANKDGLDKEIRNLKKCARILKNEPTNHTDSEEIIFAEWKECLKSNDEAEVNKFLSRYDALVTAYKEIASTINLSDDQQIWQIPIVGVIYRHLRFGVIELPTNSENYIYALRSLAQFLGKMINDSLRNDDERLFQLFYDCANHNIQEILRSRKVYLQLYLSILLEEFHRRDVGSRFLSRLLPQTELPSNHYILKKYCYFISLVRYIPFYKRFELWQEMANNFERAKDRNDHVQVDKSKLIHALRNDTEMDYVEKRKNYETDNFESILLFDISMVSRSWLMYFYLLNAIDLDECKKLIEMIKIPKHDLLDRIRQLNRLIDIPSGEYLDLEDWDIMERQNSGVYSPPSARDWLIPHFCYELMKQPDFINFSLGHENTQRTQHIFDLVINKLEESKSSKGRLFDYIKNVLDLKEEAWDYRIHQLKSSISKYKSDFEINEIRLTNAMPLDKEKLLSYKRELSEAYSSNSLLSIFENFQVINYINIDSDPEFDYFLPKRYFQIQNQIHYVGQIDIANQLIEKFENNFYSKITTIHEIFQIAATNMNQVFEVISDQLNGLGYSPSIFILTNDFYWQNDKFEGLFNRFEVHQIKNTINTLFNWNGVPIIIDYHENFQGPKIIAIDVTNAIEINQTQTFQDGFTNNFPITIKELNDHQAEEYYNANPELYSKRNDYPKSKENAIQYILSQAKIDCFAKTILNIKESNAILVSEVQFIDAIV